MQPLLVAALVAAAAAQKPWTDAPVFSSRPTAPPASIAQLVRQSMPAVVGIVSLSARGSADPFHDFLARGGDGYAMFADTAPAGADTDAPSVAGEVIEYIKRMGTLRTGVEGRVVLK